MDLEAKTFQEYLAILKRRKWQFFLPALAFIIFASVAALIWPPTYRSSAVVLVEEPDVPLDFVKSTVSGYASERIQVITQRVLTTSNLARVIEKYDLYPDERKRHPMSDVVDKMRVDTNLNMINAEVVDPHSGRSAAATIAFNVTFDHRQPETAQTVLHELVSLYLAENKRSRKEQAKETTDFLIKEANKYDNLVNELEAKLADFKERHAGSLPDEMQFNSDMMQRTDRELLQVRSDIQAAEERRVYVKTQLNQVSPYASSGPSKPDVISPAARLEALQAKFISLSAIYGPDHPDVRRVVREIKALRGEVGDFSGIGRAELEQQQQQIQSEISAARERYSADHPDVQKLQRQLDAVQAALANAGDESGKQQENPTNPAYIQLAAEYEALGTKLRSLRNQQSSLQKKLQLYEQRMSEAPRVEQDYLLLRRDYESALATQKEIAAKLTTAQIGRSLEESQKSERLSLIEPPSLPTRPIKPNRLAIIVIGIVLALGAGIGSVIVFEVTDQKIYGPRQLAALTGASPLVVIGHIQNRAEIQRAWAERAFISLTVVTVIGGVLFVVNSTLVPLEALWPSAEQKLRLLMMNMGLG